VALLATMGYGSRTRPAASSPASALIAGVVAGVGLCVSILVWNREPPALEARAVPQSLPETRPAPATPLAPPEHVEPAVPTTTLQNPPEPPRQASPTDDFRRALGYQRAGDLDNAIRVYRRMLARDELPAQAHNNLGLIYQQRGQLDEAESEFGHALVHEPRYARAHNNLGVLFLARHRIEAAIVRFRAAAAIDPRDPDPIVNLALAEKAAGKGEKAKESLLAALVLSPDSALAHYNLAVIYDGSGENARAVEHYRAFLERGGAEYAARAADVRIRLAALGTDR